MSRPQFQADRREALRQQLVKLPALTGAKDAVAHRPRLARRVLLTAATAAVGALVVGQISVTAQSAHAAGVLRAAAEQTMTFVDPVAKPGEYLLVHTHANWSISSADASGNISTRMNVQTIDVYVPGHRDEEWVLDRDWGDMGPAPMGDGIIRAKDGHFYGGPWTPLNDEEMQDLPRDGQALYDHFNAQYQGGSASRDEDNFVRITDLLRLGLVPADLRAGLYEALALIPGVTASEQANFDGKVGIAIGRTEPLRAGKRAEMIIDPGTGAVIGERNIMTYAAFGFGSNDVVGHTAIEYRIVDEAPQ